MLSPHFALEELIVSDTAARYGIDNYPSDEALNNLKETALMLEAVRAILWNKPILITSGYRSPELNERIGGSRNSDHMYGRAVDFTCPGYGNPYQICKQIEVSGMTYNQLIYEFGSWVHLSWAPNMKQESLTIDRNGTRYGI